MHSRTSIPLMVVLLSLFLFFGCSSEPIKSGVEFASKEHFELTNSYQNLLSITLSAPSAGYVVLTGSGYLKMLYEGGTGWASVSIGTNSGSANTENETAVEIPAGSPNGGYNYPFSLTTVLSVEAGDHNFYMVGIRDPNPGTYYANSLKLTAIFVKARL